MAGIGRITIAAVILASTVLAAVCVTGCKKPRPRKPVQSTTKPAAQERRKSQYDADYAGALAVADMFCQAWKTRDYYTGQNLLSARMTKKYTPQKIRETIMGRVNPKHGAYEISDGRKSDGRKDGPNRIEFKLRLFHIYSGRNYDRIEAPLRKMVIEKDERGQWKVDGFPIP